MERHVKKVLRFLRRPVEVGVHYQRAIIGGQQIHDFWKYLKNYAKKKRGCFEIEEPLLDMDIDVIGDIGKWWLTQSMEEMLNFLLKLDICPEGVKEWADYGTVVLPPEYAEELDTEYYFLAQKAYIADAIDALSIEIEPRAYPNLVIDIIGFSPLVLEKFRSFILSVPVIGEKVIFMKEKKKHAMEYVSLVYPSVAALWIDNMARLMVRGDVVDLLEATIDYFYTRDWRTAIILSSISLEKVLAEFYEEIFKRPCPPRPIGDIKHEIIKVVKDLPEEIKDAIDMTNNMRIAAVHRSHLPLGVKEATNALQGAIKFILWFQEYGTGVQSGHLSDRSLSSKYKD